MARRSHNTARCGAIVNLLPALIALCLLLSQAACFARGNDIDSQSSSLITQTVVRLDSQMNVLDGQMSTGVKLKGQVKQDTPVSFTQVGGVKGLFTPDWKTLEEISPSTGEVLSKDPSKGEDIAGQPAYFVRPPMKPSLSSTCRTGNLIAPTEGRIGPRFEPLRLPVREWVHPSLMARGVVVLVHGTTQHSGSFEVFANHIANLGFKVVSLDMRGHGRWYHRPEDFKVGGRANYSKSAADLLVLLTHLRVKYPTLPIFLIGESCGAAVSVRAGSANPDLVDGLILVSPGSRPRVFHPVMVVRDFCKGITNLDRMLDVTRYIKRYSSDDSRVTHEMVTDPLSRTTLNGKEILQTGYFISTTAHFAKKLPEHLKVLIVQGELDGIVFPNTTNNIFKNMPTQDKKLLTLRNTGHVLLGTSFLKSEVVDSITDFLLQESSKALKLDPLQKAHANH